MKTRTRLLWVLVLGFVFLPIIGGPNHRAPAENPPITGCNDTLWPDCGG